jgi:hypothetical protein
MILLSISAFKFNLRRYSLFQLLHAFIAAANAFSPVVYKAGPYTRPLLTSNQSRF